MDGSREARGISVDRVVGVGVNGAGDKGPGLRVLRRALAQVF